MRFRESFLTVTENEDTRWFAYVCFHSILIDYDVWYRGTPTAKLKSCFFCRPYIHSFDLHFNWYQSCASWTFHSRLIEIPQQIRVIDFKLQLEYYRSEMRMGDLRADFWFHLNQKPLELWKLKEKNSCSVLLAESSNDCNS